MNESPAPLTPAPLTPASLPGGSGEIALLTAIHAALDAAPGELPDRAALVRHYISVALDSLPGSRRAAYKVIAHMIVRDIGESEPNKGG